VAENPQFWKFCSAISGFKLIVRQLESILILVQRGICHVQHGVHVSIHRGVGAMSFKRLFLIGAASMLMTAGARAADIVAPPEVYDWTGFYVGLQAGYAWDKVEIEETDAVTGEQFDFYDDYNLEGFVGGAHIGYNFQNDALLLGLEADGEYSDISGDQDFNGSPDSTDDDIEWLASLRLRLGYAMDRALLYATGGVAIGEVHMRDIDDVNGTDSDNETAVGYTVGGGIEYAVSDSVSARVEYRYTDLGHTTNTTDVYNPIFNDNPLDEERENTFHAVRGGISWHFD
jgi:outer membrane immunogenic protein